MDSSVRLDQWMTLLREDIRDNISIIYLAIPGTHDSMTFGINSKSKLAPDAEKGLRFIYRFFPYFVRRWAKTQKFNVTEQLNNGVRFFDLRISKKDNTGPQIEFNTADNFEIYYFVHALFANQVENALIEINTFLEENPKELVILDFQHFYNIYAEDHFALYKCLKSIFGDKIYGPDNGRLADLTLTKAYKQNKQVVIVYRGNYFAPDLWPGSFWPTPWPRATSARKLREYLDVNLKKRRPGFGYVSQCVITPDGDYIGKRIIFSLVHTAKHVLKYVGKWIEEQSPGNLDDNQPHINVVLADFINVKNSKLAYIIVQLNDKLMNVNDSGEGP